MAITVKKGPHGFYVEGLLCDVMGVPLPDQPDPTRSPLEISFNQPDCMVYLNPLVPLRVKDIHERELDIYTAKDSAMITHVRDLEDREVTMFTLSDDNGFWYFANGVPLDGPPT